MITSRKLERVERVGAASLLATSLADDEGVVALAGASKQDSGAIRRWFEIMLEVIADTGGAIYGAFSDNELLGVLVAHPTRQSASILPMLKWVLKMLVFGGPAAISRIGAHDVMRRKTFGTAELAVEFVAVTAAARGRGVARILFARIGDRHLWLETTKQENRKIFAALGFEEATAYQEGGVTYYCMKRMAERFDSAENGLE